MTVIIYNGIMALCTNYFDCQNGRKAKICVNFYFFFGAMRLWTSGRRTWRSKVKQIAHESIYGFRCLWMPQIMIECDVRKTEIAAENFETEINKEDDNTDKDQAKWNRTKQMKENTSTFNFIHIFLSKNTFASFKKLLKLIHSECEHMTTKKKKTKLATRAVIHK